MIDIVVLASGRGSNFDAILAGVRSGSIPARIRAVLSDREGAPVLGKARDAGIPAEFVAFEKGGTRETHDGALLRALAPYQPRFLVLAGYMRLVGPAIVEAFRSDAGYSRITNIHPSLLPAFPGLEGYGKAWRHGAQVTGCTVHLVDAGLDSGPICAQAAFSIADCASAQEVETLGLRQEHRLYPETLMWVLPEKFTVGARDAASGTSGASGTAGRLCVRKN